MTVKGIIQNINFNSNTCSVRLPYFENAGNTSEVVVNAVFSNTPGSYNGYKVGDVVFVEFENEDFDQAVVVGKLYLGAKEESADGRGAFNVSALTVNGTATIPITTKLSYPGNSETTVNVKNDLNTYKSIEDIARGLQKQETQIGSINAQLIDNGDSIGARVSKLEEDSSRHEAELIVHADEIEARVTKYSKDFPKECEGFGWSMDEKGIVFESALGIKDANDKYVENKTEVLKINGDGATVTGKLTVKDKADPQNIIFEADPFGRPKSEKEKEIKPHVLIGGWDADHNSLGLIDENGERLKIGNPNGVTIASGVNDEAVSIAKSEYKDDWCFVASDKFGVDKSGKVYMSDINVDGIEFDTSHSEPGKYFIIDVKATNVSNGVKFTAATLDGLLENDTDIDITYLDSKNQQWLTTITILAGESEGSTIVKDAKTGEGDFSWDPKYVDSTLGDFFNAYGYFNDKNKMHCAGYSFDLTPGGLGGNWDRAKAKAVSWYRITWELINNSTITKKIVALNNARWVTNDDIVCHAIDKHEFTKIHSIIEQWNSTKQYGIVAKTSSSSKVIARGSASSDGLYASLTYISEYSGTTNISISRRPGNVGTCIIDINGETITLKGKCKKFGSSSSSSYESDLTGTSSNTGKSYNLRVSRLLSTDFGVGNVSVSPSNSDPKATLIEINNSSLDINTAKPITINPQFSLVYVDDSNEDVIYLYSRISNVPQIDVKNNDGQSASYRFIPLSSDTSITSIDLSKSDFIDFSLESGESVGARYFIFDDDKLNMLVYGKNYSSTWVQEQQTFSIKIEPAKKDANGIIESVTIEETYKLTHAPQEILDIDIDDHKVDGLNWLSVHSYVENNEIKIVLANVSNANSEVVSIDVIVNYAWQQEI